MKKNLPIEEKEKHMHSFFKNLKMKITGLILIVCAFQVTAKVSYSQEKIDLDFNEVPINKVFSEIKKQTSYKFFYNTSEIDDQRIISIKVREASLNDVLSKLFIGQYITYRLINKQIVLKKEILRNKQKAHELYENLKTITGKVTEEGTTTPLPGATVVIEGTEKGTVTDFDGNFSLDANSGDILVVSFLGFETIKIPITDKDEYTIQLKPAASQLEDIVLVGSRARARTDVERAVPVDVINSRDLVSTGQTDLGQQVQFTSPSFNSAKYGVNGTTNYAEPATLRGLAPDQSLALVNGKRRHQFSALQLNVAPGLGTIVTDLNSIPTGAVKRLEVLRDGAAAQYGSDAIAGIINISLNDQNDGGNLASTAGLYGEGDGFTFKNSFNYGFRLGKDKSYFNFTLEVFRFDGTNRSDPYTGNVYSSDDAEEAAIRAERGVYPEEPFVVGNYGANQNETYQGFVNIGYPIGENWKLYGFGGVSRKDILAFGFFRNPARASRAVPEIFPDGYVPELPGTSFDFSTAIGIERKLKDGWNYDFSYNAGRNYLDLFANNTTNPSLGVASPTEFEVGRYDFRQQIAEANITKSFEIGNLKSFDLAIGAAFRNDRFLLLQGSPESFAVGPLAASDGKDIGSSARPGIADTDENDLSRDNFGFYVDIESDITEKWLLGTALRFENYSDFGSNLSGKFAARYKITDNFSIRGSYNRGFRAPSLGQIGNRVNTSSAQNGEIIITRQISSDNPALAALGVKDPEAEISNNFNLGLTAKLFDGNLLLTVDAFQILIDDRIAITDRLSADDFPIINTLFENTREIRFFTNQIDTQTIGLDVVATYKNRFSEKSNLTTTLAFTFNETTIEDQRPIPKGLLEGADPGEADKLLVGEVAQQLIEVAQPRTKLLFSLNYKYSKLAFTSRISHFGSVIAKDRTIGDQKFTAKTLTDLALSYDFSEKFTLTLGSNNVFDVFPDKWRNFQDGDAEQAASYANGQIPFTRNANQFGFNGAYYYLSTNITF